MPDEAAKGRAGMLSQADIEQLLRNPSPESRTRVAGKIADIYDKSALTEREQQLADGILRLLAKDVELAVRKALSHHLQSNPDVPHDIARKLAMDVIEVAEPILRHSEVLTTIDLIDIVRTREPAAQVAVAKRRSVPEPLSDALAATGVELVIATLVRNDGAEISERTFDRVIADYGDRENVAAGIVSRSHLPAAVTERLIGVVSDSLKLELIGKHDVPAEIAEKIVLRSQEDTVKDLLGSKPAKRDVGSLVKGLARQGRLSGRIVLRALDVGDREFFEHGMAKLAGVPLENATRLISDRGTQGLLALYRKARLPEDNFPSVRYQVDKLYNLRAGSTYAPTTSPGANMVGFEGDFFGGGGGGWVGSN
ncbi:MAG: DUF2336 domain-containing protein [Rhodospirillales bacterium]